MKKILSFIVVAAAVAMVGCAGNPSKPAAEAEAAATEVVAPACDQNCETCEKAEECTEKKCCDKAECAEKKCEKAEKCCEAEK